MSKKILIVDDDEDLLEIMVERMRMRDMTVVPAKTASEALILIKQETFDVMIIDFMLPGIDGLQAIKMIREKQPDMRIILLTAYATIEKESEALAMGAWDVEEKPVDFDRLAQLIKSQQPSAKAEALGFKGPRGQGVK